MFSSRNKKTINLMHTLIYTYVPIAGLSDVRFSNYSKSAHWFQRTRKWSTRWWNTGRHFTAGRRHLTLAIVKVNKIWEALFRMLIVAKFWCKLQAIMQCFKSTSYSNRILYRCENEQFVVVHFLFFFFFFFFFYRAVAEPEPDLIYHISTVHFLVTTNLITT